MSCIFETNRAVLDKVREKGFSNDPLTQSYELDCKCGATVTMTTFETKCNNCDGIFVVTPCSQEDANSIVFID